MSQPTAFELLEAKRKKIANELAQLERDIYNEETTYFTQDFSSFGNVLKGFEGFLTSKNAQARNKNRSFNLSDRAFSLSSYTSPATRELLEEREQYADPIGYARGKGSLRGVDSIPPAKQGRY